MLCIKKQRAKSNSTDLIKIFPCGKCMPCVMTRKQEWTSRLLLEMKTHLMTYYATLTYADQDLPPQGELHKPDLQDFWKRLRKNTGLKLRYFACGEYGEKKGRPHYHLLIFTDREFALKYDRIPDKKGIPRDKIVDSDIHQAWYAGSFVDLVPILDSKSRRHTASYVAGYVLKKMDPNYQDTEHEQKEFILSSRKPGIGHSYAKLIANRLKRNGVGLPGTDGVCATSDVHMIRIDGKLYPLGRYMREKILEELGGDLRPKWAKELAQHHKAMDQIEQAEELAELESESSARARKAYSTYLKNRKL